MSGQDGELGHILPKSLYYKVFWALMVLTFLTVFVAQFDFGIFNMVIAMGIASVKAGLVAAIFMHLRFENPITWLYAFFPLVLLAILIAGVFIDNPLRSGAGF